MSNGKIQEPIVFKNWEHDLPKQAMLRWTGTEYEIIFTYSRDDPETRKKGKIVGVDIGQIHIVACSDGMILNGRKLRSTRQWKDKKLADLQQKLSSKKKGSRECKRLKKAKMKFLKVVKNKSKDILHKLTTGLVATMKNKGVSTLVVGDLRGYRLDKNDGRTRNQENHAWKYNQITSMLNYKCKIMGLHMKLQEESYTSQTCPKCFNRKKQRGRNYVCKKCGFVGHRDIVGATNILSKYLGGFGSQVVADMAPAFGVRYKPNINVTCGFKLQESTLIYQQ